MDSNSRKHQFREQVYSILRQERQWNRSCRIAYANYRMGTAANREEHQLWSAVLAANSGSDNSGGANVNATA